MDPLTPLRGPELSIIVPTFNERDNVVELVERIGACLRDCAWELLYVDDDSPDGTADLVRQLAAKDSRIRCLQRLGRRGLSSACVEGMLASSAPYLAVIDGDLQHDERLLPQMLATLKQGDTDMVVGSRYVAGGGTGDWGAARIRLSKFGTRLSRMLVPDTLTDPMSGFFMLRRPVFESAVRKLSNIGTKILMDLFASSPAPLRFKELPYSFRLRQAGVSKLDSLTAWEYAMLLLDKLFGHLVPVRFVAFCIVGALGVVVHFTILSLLRHFAHADFIVAQASATVCTMTFNFAVNNVLTYRDRRLRGLRWLRGWLSFNVACGLGACMNVGLATYVNQISGTWYIAALTGIAVGAVWNYAVTKRLTWARSQV
ncbi:MAG TPA: glycosyltransferase family 2 protein [Steroidobacteraceae bacterium]|nr:glycosyltransferase family 2 protein [Steroidobacteraceae bacterium]